MIFDGGTLQIFRLVNDAQPGMMPKMRETLIESACYGERTVGATRYYNAQQADMQVDILVRIPRTYNAKTGDRVRLMPYSHEPSEFPYLVIQVQQVTDEENLPATDLSLRIMTPAEVDNDAG